MSGRLHFFIRAIALPCLMVLAMTSASFAATFRYDPISIANPPAPPVTFLDQYPYEQQPYPWFIGYDPSGVGTSNWLTSYNPVRFQVTKIVAPIIKVSIRVWIQHENINELTLTLYSPDGTRVRLAQRLGKTDDPNVVMSAGGFAQYVEFMSVDEPTPPLITAPTSLINNGSLVPAGRYRPAETLGIFNGKTGTQANGIWRLTVQDSVDSGFTGAFYGARLYITQDGGVHVWTGSTGVGADTNWSNPANWDVGFGPPDVNQTNTLAFPSGAASLLPFNDFNNTVPTISTIASVNYPIAPFFTVPAADSGQAVVLTMSTAPAQPVNVSTAWAALVTAAYVGDDLIIANDLVAAATGTFRVLAVNKIGFYSLTIVRVGAAGTGTVVAGGGPNATMQLIRHLDTLEIGGVNFIGEDYNITGSPVIVTDRAQFVNPYGVNNKWALNSAIEAGIAFLDINGGVLHLTGIWSGAGGFTKEGLGTAELTRANSFTGQTLIKGGIIDITNANALGANATGGDTVIRDGGTLRVAAGLTVYEKVTISGLGASTPLTPPIGALVFSGNATYAGDLALKASGNSTISVLAGAVILSSIVPELSDSTYSLSIANAGTVAINSPLPIFTNLSLAGGATTFGAAQPNLANLTLTGAGLNSGANAMTIIGSVSSGASATTSTLRSSASGSLNLKGTGHVVNVAAGAAGAGGSANITSSDLIVTATTTNGSFTKTGGGVMRISNAPGVAATVNEGTLASVSAVTCSIGSIAVNSGAVLSPAGRWDVGSAVTLATSSALILPLGATFPLPTPRINTLGSVTLDAGGAVGGVSGAVLQVYSGDGTTIINAGSVTGLFSGMPNGAGITYPATTVDLFASGNRSLKFIPTAYTANENAGSVQVTVMWTGVTGTQPLLRNYGGGVKNNLDVQFLGLSGVAGASNTVIFTVPIVQNRIQSGDQTTNLVIVPQDGSLVTNSAILTIIDDDFSEGKKCGLGTGLTVFLLFGFALFFGLRLRRR